MPATGEIISIHVGQGGCELGNACWEMYCIEHNVRPDGQACGTSPPVGFFSMSGAGKVVPRATFIDLEPSVIDEIRTGQYRELFAPSCLLSGKEDAANCFARGYVSQGREMIDPIMDVIRKMVEDCSTLQGFLIFRTYGGGTGSGLVALVLEQLANEYPRNNKFEFSVYPSPELSNSIVEPYNASLATHESLEHATGSFLIDNEACYDICERFLDVCSPSLTNVNRLMGQVLSSVTSSLRFEDTVNVNLSELKTNLIPFPRIHHSIVSYAPLTSPNQLRYQRLTESTIINSCFEPSNLLLKCDTRKGKYMACTLLLRGNVTNAVVNSAIMSIRTKKCGRFVSWCPTAFKIGVNNVPPVAIPGGDMALVDKGCTMLASSTAIKTSWSRLNWKFDLMFSKKAFMHWYISEGLEEADFHDTRLDLAALESDYREAENEDLPDPTT